MRTMSVSHPIDFGMSSDNPIIPTFAQNVGTSSSLNDLRPNDVICGRDKLTHSHTGNKKFRQIVMSFREQYQSSATRENKTNITCRIVMMIRQSGGRFLKQDELTGEWKDVADQYAREKVSHALRSAKDPNRPKPKKRRQVRQHVPTVEEDKLFEKALADQQRIYKMLLACDDGKVDGLDADDIESLLSDL